MAAVTWPQMLLNGPDWAGIILRECIRRCSTGFLGFDLNVLFTAMLRVILLYLLLGVNEDMPDSQILVVRP
jgi:hypothetical protein